MSQLRGLSGRTRALVVIAVTVATAALPTLASAAPEPSASDPQHADFVPGNVVDCSQVGLANSTTLFADGDSSLGGAVTGTVQAHPGGGQEAHITAVAPGVTIDAVVVKGGPAYNVYLPDPPGSGSLPGSHVFPAYPGPYIAPLNPGGQVPAFSHWFACYHGGDTPPPPEPPGPGSLTVVKVVTNPGGAALPASYTVHITCDDGTDTTRTLPANGGPALEGAVTGILANSLCNVEETTVPNVTAGFTPVAAGPGGTGIEVESGQTVTVTVTNAFTAVAGAVTVAGAATAQQPAATAQPVVVSPRFTG